MTHIYIPHPINNLNITTDIILSFMDGGSTILYQNTPLPPPMC